MHRALLAKLHAANQIDWSRAVVDSSSVRAVLWGTKNQSESDDRGKAGNKHHALTDARGVPLAAVLTVANAHDVTQLLPLVDAVQPKAG